MSANRQQPAQGLDFAQRRLQFADQTLPLLLRPLALGNIPSRNRDAHHLAIRSFHRGNRQRQLHPRAAFRLLRGLKVAQPLPAPHSLQHLRNLLAALYGKEHGKRAPNGFRVRITVELLRRGIPGDDQALQRFPDDGVLRRLDDRRQLGAGGFRAFAGTNITKKDGDPFSIRTGMRLKPLILGRVGRLEMHRFPLLHDPIAAPEYLGRLDSA